MTSCTIKTMMLIKRRLRVMGGMFLSISVRKIVGMGIHIRARIRGACTERYEAFMSLKATPLHNLGLPRSVG